MILQALRYAVKCHRETNHKYNDMPYDYHLDMVVDVAERFSGLIPKEKLDIVISSCWTHDVIEDCRQTYNDVLKSTNKEVADITYALTNEKGKNRAERANDKYYEGIRNTPYAAFVKICDRIANFKYSIESGSSMAKMYAKENEDFIAKVWDKQYEPMLEYLRELAKRVN